MTEHKEPIRPIIYKWISNKWVSIPIAVIICVTIVLTWLVKVKGDVKYLFANKDSESRELIPLQANMRRVAYTTDNRTDTNGYIWPLQVGNFKYQDTKVITIPGCKDDYIIRYKGDTDEGLSFHIMDETDMTENAPTETLDAAYKNMMKFMETYEFKVGDKEYRYRMSDNITNTINKVTKGNFISKGIMRDDNKSGTTVQHYSLMLMAEVDNRILMIRYSYSSNSKTQLEMVLEYAIKIKTEFQKFGNSPNQSVNSSP